MIFVVLGTWEMPFIRPLIELEKAVSGGLISETVLVQSGKTSYPSTHLTLVPFFDQQELEEMYDQASLIICQAGVGSIMLGLRKQKKVIAVARRHAYQEHVDEHQLEILETFASAGTVLRWNAEGDLPNVLRLVENFVPIPYPFSEERISGEILSYLNSLNL